jgi:hypothetical protein
LSCQPGHAPGPVLHALQELRSVIDERLRVELGPAYEHHRAQSVGSDKLTAVFTLRAASPAEAVRAAGLAAANLLELPRTPRRRLIWPASRWWSEPNRRRGAAGLCVQATFRDAPSGRVVRIVTGAIVS